MKEKSSPFLKILSVVAAIALAHLFSLIPFSVENDAKGFDGDTSKSGFVEMSPTGNDVQPLFSETERAEIDGAVKQAAEKLQMNILVYASRSPLSDYDTEFFCDDNYDEMYGPDTDGIFYYMDLSGKSPAYDYISTSGKAILAYQAAKDNIFYALDKYLPSSVDVQANGLEPYKEGIAGAVHEFLDQIDSYSVESVVSYTGKEPSGTFYGSRTGKYVYYQGGTLCVTKSRPPKHRAVLFFVSEVIGLLAAWILSSSVRKRYVFINETKANIYLDESDIRFDKNEDTFLRENTSRMRMSSSGGGGGGRGGGHSGGGGTHGGGGHHR